MKHCDIQKLHDAGLITDEQRRKIIEHFNLKEDGGNKFLAIVSIIGAVLIAAGIALLISAHWNEIPRGVKIAGGLALMLGAHAGGWWLREKPRTPPLSPSDGGGVQGREKSKGKTGEALQLIGFVPVSRKHRAARSDLQHRLAPAKRVSALVARHRCAAVAAALQGPARPVAARLRHLVRFGNKPAGQRDFLRFRRAPVDGLCLARIDLSRGGLLVAMHNIF